MLDRSSSIAVVCSLCLGLGLGCKRSPPPGGNESTPTIAEPAKTGAAAPTPAAPSGPTWTKMSSPAGRFEALMLQGYKEEKSSTPTAAGNIETVSYLISLPEGRAYFISYADYPANLVNAGNREKILDGARDGASNNVGGKILSEKKVMMDGSAGRDIVIAASTQPVTVRLRMTLVQNRLYMMQALAAGALRDVPDPDADKFMESLRFIKPGAPQAKAPAVPVKKK